ncbi:hypothetical protein B0H14DRAFT_3131521 [Mycena olivaceomarginata]|nr:hypothetical protein B0H14DRAFT_3131521 [Mycena olivaceomarginata]
MCRVVLSECVACLHLACLHLPRLHLAPPYWRCAGGAGCRVLQGGLEWAGWMWIVRGHLSTSPGRDETRDARPAPLPFLKYAQVWGKGEVGGSPVAPGEKEKRDAGAGAGAAVIRRGAALLVMRAETMRAGSGRGAGVAGAAPESAGVENQGAGGGGRDDTRGAGRIGLGTDRLEMRDTVTAVVERAGGDGTCCLWSCGGAIEGADAGGGCSGEERTQEEACSASSFGGQAKTMTMDGADGSGSRGRGVHGSPVCVWERVPAGGQGGIPGRKGYFYYSVSPLVKAGPRAQRSEGRDGDGDGGCDCGFGGLVADGVWVEGRMTAAEADAHGTDDELTYGLFWELKGLSAEHRVDSDVIYHLTGSSTVCRRSPGPENWADYSYVGCLLVRTPSSNSLVSIREWPASVSICPALGTKADSFPTESPWWKLEHGLRVQYHGDLRPHEELCNTRSIYVLATSPAPTAWVDFAQLMARRRRKRCKEELLKHWALPGQFSLRRQTLHRRAMPFCRTVPPWVLLRPVMQNEDVEDSNAQSLPPDNIHRSGKYQNSSSWHGMPSQRRETMPSEMDQAPGVQACTISFHLHDSHRRTTGRSTPRICRIRD